MRRVKNKWLNPHFSHALGFGRGRGGPRGFGGRRVGRGLVSERQESGVVGETWIMGVAPPYEGFGKGRKFAVDGVVQQRRAWKARA